MPRSHFYFSRSHVSYFRFHTHTCVILCRVWLWFFLGSGQSQIDDESAEKNLRSCHRCCNPSFERGEGCASCCRFAWRTLCVLGNDNITFSCFMLCFIPLLSCSLCVMNCLQPVCVFYCFDHHWILIEGNPTLISNKAQIACTWLTNLEVFLDKLFHKEKKKIYYI